MEAQAPARAHECKHDTERVSRGRLRSRFHILHRKKARKNKKTKRRLKSFNIMNSIRSYRDLLVFMGFFGII